MVAIVRNGPGELTEIDGLITEQVERIEKVIKGVQRPPGYRSDTIDPSDSRKVLVRLVDYPHHISKKYIGQLEDAFKTESMLSEEEVRQSIAASIVAIYEHRGTFIAEAFGYCCAHLDEGTKNTVQWNRFVAQMLRHSVKHAFDDERDEIAGRDVCLREIKSIFYRGNEDLIHDLDFRILKASSVTTPNECEEVSHWLEELGVKNARLRMAFRYASFDPVVTYPFYVDAILELTPDQVAEEIKNQLIEVVVDPEGSSNGAELLAFYLKDQTISLDHRIAVAKMFAETFAPLQKITKSERVTLRDANHARAIKMDPDIFRAYFVECFINLYGINPHGSGSRKVPLPEKQIQSVIVESLRDFYLAELVESSVLAGVEALHVVSLKMEELMAREGSESTVLYSTNITDGLKAIARSLDPGIDKAQYQNRVPLELQGWATFRG